MARGEASHVRSDYISDVTSESPGGRGWIRAFLSSMLGAYVPVAAAGPLTITNVDSPDPVQSGNQILYTIVVKNTGGAKVNNVVLTDQINQVVGFGNPPCSTS